MKCILPLLSVSLILGHFFQANAQVSQTPYWGVSFVLPSKIEAEDYDEGGQGIAYNDTDVVNQGNAYRKAEGVDVEVCSEGGYNIGYMASGEWMEYSVNVTTTSSYKFDFRTASTQTGGMIRVDIDDLPATTNIALPNTTGWQNWTTTSVTGISLSAGQHILRVFVVAGGFNLNYIDFTRNNKLPVVSISAPSNGTTFTAPASFSLNANASDADGTVSKVEFYNGTTLLGTALTAPYSFYWPNVPEGTYKVTAKATDNLGASTISATVTLIITTIVIPNQPPSIVLTAPVNNSIANVPANITISADAKDADGAISRVEFYNGTVLLGIDNVAPYNYNWIGVVPGVYTITAKAFDNLGASKVSSTVVTTVLAVVTDICSGIATYIENSNYVAGSKVRNNNGLYECRPWPFSGWCNGADWAYAPGSGAYWTDAWTFTGSCGDTRSSESSTEVNLSAVLTIFPNPFLSSAVLSVVVKESDQLSVKLYDKSGQYLKTITEDYFLVGSYQFPLNLEGERAGIYQVKCITRTDSKIIKIQKAE